MLKRLRVLIILILIAWGAYYVVYQSELLTIKTILYNQNEELDIYELQRYSKISYGMSFFNIDLLNAKKSLEEHPYVKQVVINKKFPSTIIFNITYKEHCLNIEYSDITLSLDRDLDVLKVVEENINGYVVKGFEFKGFSTGKKINVEYDYVLKNIVSLIELMGKSGLEYKNEITYSNMNIKINIDEIVVKFGNGENIEKRFNSFIAIYESLKKDSITFGTIDVSTDGLPVYKPFGE